MPTTGRILVTGAGGFIGRSAVATLGGAAALVRAVDVRPLGTLPGASEVVTSDLGPAVDLRPLFAEVSTVVHLAARAHVLRDRAADPLAEFRAANTELTARLARGAAAAGVRRFVFLSSIGVLGESTDGRPFNPASPAAPVTPYAISKWEAEQALARIASETGLEVVILRPTLVHGPGAPGNFERLLRLVDLGLPLPFARVQARRTFLGRRNLCTLLAAAIAAPRGIATPLLAGDRESLTLPELLEVLGEGLGKRLRFFGIPDAGFRALQAVAGAPLRKLSASLEVDVSATCRALDWTPVQSARDGLLEMARAWKGSR